MWIDVDLSEMVAEAGEQPVLFENFSVRNRPQSLLVNGFSPAQMVIDLDEVGQRNFTIEAVHIGTPATGYVVNKVQISPSVVALSGPRASLGHLRSVKTLPIDVSGLRHDNRVEVLLDIPRNFKTAGGQPIVAQIDIEARLSGRALHDVPVYVRSPHHWAVSPSHVSVRLEGPTASVRRVRDEEVVVIVEISGDVKGNQLEVSFAKGDGPRATVVVPSDTVSAVNMEPQVLKVKRK